MICVALLSVKKSDLSFVHVSPAAAAKISRLNDKSVRRISETELLPSPSWHRHARIAQPHTTKVCNALPDARSVAFLLCRAGNGHPATMEHPDDPQQTRKSQAHILTQPIQSFRS